MSSGEESSVQQMNVPTQLESESTEITVDLSSLVEITPILRVANEVEPLNPRVAYLCRFYAFERAVKLDPNANGRGVRQFRRTLLRRLERENNETSTMARNHDGHEMKNFYEQHYRKYIQALQTEGGKDHRAQMTKACQTANVLFEVSKAVNHVEADAEILETEDKIAETETCVRYNILPRPPPPPDCANEVITQYPDQIRDARDAVPVHALHDSRVVLENFVGTQLSFTRKQLATKREEVKELEKMEEEMAKMLSSQKVAND